MVTIDALRGMPEEIKKAVTNATPGNDVSSLWKRGLGAHLPSLREALESVRCGRVNRREFTGKDGPLYTKEELSWFITERMGMYTAINGVVYDLTGNILDLDRGLYIWNGSVY